MTSFTDRLGLIKQAYGTNPETWGTELNNAVIDLVDDAMAYEPITVNSDVTLSADDGIENQARRYLLVFTGDGGHTVTVKDVDRWYLVYNKCSADVTIKPDAGTGSDVRAGTCVLWTTNGSTSETADVSLDKIAKPLANVDFNGKKIVNAGKGSDPADVASLSNEFKDFAKPTADLDINGQKLTNVAKGTNTNDAATLANEIQHFAKPTAAMDMNGQKLTNVGAPTAPTDAATKGYIDTLAASSDLGTVAAVADEIRVLADIQDGTVATNTLTDLAPIKDEIASLATIKDEIVQLNGMDCGASATDPVTRRDGSALEAGDFYINTYDPDAPVIKVYSGSVWVAFEGIPYATPEEAEEGSGDGVMTASLTGLAIASLAGDVVLETFTTSGTFTKDDDDLAYFVELWGGGGSGARYTGTNQGGGGGGGEYVSAFLLAADVPGSVSVTVGAGGARRAADGDGQAGGNSSFGSLATAMGGGGGPASSGMAALPRTGGLSATNNDQQDIIIRLPQTHAGRGGAGGNPNRGTGGDSVWGGAGGGGASSANFHPGGTSEFGGNGGDAGDTAGQDGQAPGGGGGASRGTSGAGARGEVRVYRFKRIKQ